MLRLARGRGRQTARERGPLRLSKIAANVHPRGRKDGSGTGEATFHIPYLWRASAIRKIKCPYP